MDYEKKVGGMGELSFMSRYFLLILIIVVIRMIAWLILRDKGKAPLTPPIIPKQEIQKDKD